MENTESIPDTINGTRYLWRLHASDHRLADKIAKELGLPPLVALILTIRHITTTTQAHDYLDCRLENLHPPDDMPDLDKAVNLIARALEQGEQIAVYGDYDVDGITATALLVHFLSSLMVQYVGTYRTVFRKVTVSTVKLFKLCMARVSL